MKKVLILAVLAVISGCNEQASCPETVLVETPYGNLEVIKGELTDRYFKAAEAAAIAERNLDNQIVDTPSKGY